MIETVEIAPRTGTAFAMSRGDRLKVIDPCGEQVADLLAFSRHDIEEVLSSGRTLDYVSRIFLTAGDPLYSNRSNIMMRIIEDTVGRHDFLLTPCSSDTFRIIYGDQDPHRGCFGNLAVALEPFGILTDRIPVAFNCFMNVRVDGETGVLRVDAPLTKAGDYITFVAEMDLIIGLTACSALQSNNGSFKPIRYSVTPKYASTRILGDDKERPQNEPNETTKPARQDVPAPGHERVDDEVGGGDKKTTQRQE